MCFGWRKGSYSNICSRKSSGTLPNIVIHFVIVIYFSEKLARDVSVTSFDVYVFYGDLNPIFNVLCIV
jgi:hypothetical protein